MFYCYRALLQIADQSEKANPISYFQKKRYDVEMKLAIDCRMTKSGGVGSYLNALLPFLTKKNECLLLGNTEELEKFKSEKTELLQLDIKTFSVKELFAFPKNIAKKINKCDVFYSPYFNVPSGIKIPVYTTIHDVVFLDVPGLASKTGTFVRKLFYSYAVFKSKKIFTVSEFSKARIISDLNCKKPVVVTYNAVPDWFYCGEKKNISENKSEEKENSILFVGNIKKHKGLSILIDALKIAVSKGFKLKLKIVGNAENFRTQDESVFQKIKEVPEGFVEFTGRISDEELKNLYKKTKRLVQPSLYEGFGMPPLEAMSLGTKAIISDIPVFREIYKDFPVTFFKSGDCNDLAEKLLSIINEDDKLKKFPEVYSFEKTAEIIQTTLEQEK